MLLFLRRLNIYRMRTGFVSWILFSLLITISINNFLLFLIQGEYPGVGKIVTLDCYCLRLIQIRGPW